MRTLAGFFVVAATLGASADVVTQATSLYDRTRYEDSLRVLAQDTAPDAADYLLTGKNHFMLGDYKKAVDFFEKVLAVTPRSSEAELWLGRAWGRRAESSAMAIVYAGRAREAFEKAVTFDPHNREAKNDLFDFYLNAPGVLGGGVDKAEAAARGIATERPAEFEFEEAQIAEKRNDSAGAEKHLRRAVELAPGEPGRLVDLARWLARHGHLAESDRLFEEAEKLAPGQPGVIFAEAKTDIENHRNADKARRLLQSYLQAILTPDDPPRQEAEKLLRRVSQ